MTDRVSERAGKVQTGALRMTAAAVRREVSALRNPERARFLQRYFRTGPGEYGEGDRMLGLTVPEQRTVARAFRLLPLPEAERLLRSEFHEHRLIALLILVDQHARGEVEDRRVLHRFYLEHMEGVNNWDLVDTSAATLVGEHLQAEDLGAADGLLDRLIVSDSVWRRRVAIVSTFAELRAGRTALTFRVAERLLGDRHDLIHKATGWLLREAGKIAPDEQFEFLRAHYDRLPRTTLRYAIERMEAMERRMWLKGAQ